MLHCLCGVPSIPLSFSLATVQADDLMRLLHHCLATIVSRHRLRRGLLGYLILFAPHAFVTERQYRPGQPPLPLVFFHISTHFTATHGVPLTSDVL